MIYELKEHMFTNPYYPNLSLPTELLKLKCHLTGTIKPNRKGLHKGIKKSNYL